MYVELWHFCRQFEWSIQLNGMGTESFAYFCIFRIIFALNVCLTHKHRVTIIHRSLLIIFEFFINGINYHGSHVIECSSVSDSNPCDLHTHSIAHLQRNVLRWWRRRRRMTTSSFKYTRKTMSPNFLLRFFFALHLNIQIYFLQHISIFICQTCRRRRCQYQYSMWPICHKSTV